MNAISVRRLDPDLHAWLQEQASAHGVSMEEEVRRLLRAAREAEQARRQAERQAFLNAVSAKAIRMPSGSPSSTEVLRRVRDEG